MYFNNSASRLVLSTVRPPLSALRMSVSITSLNPYFLVLFLAAVATDCELSAGPSYPKETFARERASCQLILGVFSFSALAASLIFFCLRLAVDIGAFFLVEDFFFDPTFLVVERVFLALRFLVLLIFLLAVFAFGFFFAVFLLEC